MGTIVIVFSWNIFHHKRSCCCVHLGGSARVCVEPSSCDHYFNGYLSQSPVLWSLLAMWLESQQLGLPGHCVQLDAPQSDLHSNNEEDPNVSVWAVVLPHLPSSHHGLRQPQQLTASDRAILNSTDRPTASEPLPQSNESVQQVLIRITFVITKRNPILNLE